MAQPTRDAEKRRLLLALLDRGIVMIHLDARVEGVHVPADHAEQPALALNISYRFGLPDLTIDDFGFTATLSFDRRPFYCAVPWAAIFLIRSHADDSFHVWPEDAPAELIEQVRVRQATRTEPTVVPVQPDHEADELPGRPTRVPHLRIIK